MSELPIFRGYFARNWPLIGQDASFVTLGVTMVILGVSILGNLNKEATSQESLGLAFWRIVISSGIVVLVMGVVNIFAVSTIRASFQLFRSTIKLTKSLSIRATSSATGDRESQRATSGPTVLWPPRRS